MTYDAGRTDDIEHSQAVRIKELEADLQASQHNGSHWRESRDAAMSQLAVQSALLDKARKALEPFAKTAEYIDQFDPDAPDSGECGVSIRALRAAHAILAEIEALK